MVKHREKDKIARASMVKTHNAFKYFKRTGNACFQMSRRNEDTKSSFLEVELRKLIEDGCPLDADLCALESNFLKKWPYTDDEIQTGEKLCEDLTTLIKKGRRRIAALKILMIVQ